MQCLNGFRNRQGYMLSEEIECQIDNHFSNSSVRCEQQQCVEFRD